MREGMDHYGTAILEGVSALAVLGIIFSCFGNGGLISSIVADYMNSLGG